MARKNTFVRMRVRISKIQRRINRVNALRSRANVVSAGSIIPHQDSEYVQLHNAHLTHCRKCKCELHLSATLCLDNPLFCNRGGRSQESESQGNKSEENAVPSTSALVVIRPCQCQNMPMPVLTIIFSTYKKMSSSSALVIKIPLEKVDWKNGTAEIDEISNQKKPFSMHDAASGGCRDTCTFQLQAEFGNNHSITMDLSPFSGFRIQGYNSKRRRPARTISPAFSTSSGSSSDSDDDHNEQPFKSSSADFATKQALPHAQPVAGEYAADESVAGEYATGEYAADEYAVDECATGEYAADEYATDEYATDEYATDEYATDEYANPSLVASFARFQPANFNFAPANFASADNEEWHESVEVENTLYQYQLQQPAHADDANLQPDNFETELNKFAAAAQKFGNLNEQLLQNHSSAELMDMGYHSPAFSEPSEETDEFLENSILSLLQQLTNMPEQTTYTSLINEEYATINNGTLLEEVDQILLSQPDLL